MGRFKGQTGQYTKSDLNNIIRGQFVGEPAVDQDRYVVLTCLLAMKPANCLITTF